MNLEIQTNVEKSEIEAMLEVIDDAELLFTTAGSIDYVS